MLAAQSRRLDSLSFRRMVILQPWPLWQRAPLLNLFFPLASTNATAGRPKGRFGKVVAAELTIQSFVAVDEQPPLSYHQTAILCAQVRRKSATP